MEALLNFMESSSICGLAQIRASKTWAERLFWIAVVVTSCVLLGYLTGQALIDWRNNPISTTTTTFPIYDVQFPKIVVCPPKVAFGFIF